jgi:hypothetical protein
VGRRRWICGTDGFGPAGGVDPCGDARSGGSRWV